MGKAAASDEKLFSQFANDISNAQDGMRRMRSCDQDGAYAFRLQRERAGRLGLRLSYTVTPYEDSPLDLLAEGERCMGPGA